MPDANREKRIALFTGAYNHVVDGVALIEIAGDTYQVGEGQVIRLPGGVPHAVQAEQRFKMLLVMIRS